MNLRCLLVCFALSLFLTGKGSAQGLEPLGAEDYAYDGFLEPAEDILVSALEMGRLEKVLVKVGDRVEAGQELAALETSLQQISVEIAREQALMTGELSMAIAEHKLQAHRAEQLRVLSQTGNARPDEVIRAETDLAIAEARILTAKEDRVTRQMELRRQEIQLERRRILSPIRGVIAKVMRRAGEHVSPGDAAIIRVIAKDSLVAVFNMPAADAAQMRVGQVVPLRPRTSPRVVDGTVESISPAIDGESGTVAVRIRLDNADESLLPGDRCLLTNARRLAGSERVLRPNALPEQVAR